MLLVPDSQLTGRVFLEHTLYCTLYALVSLYGNETYWEDKIIYTYSMVNFITTVLLAKPLIFMLEFVHQTEKIFH